MSSKQCPECGEKIVGRTDKKFCSDGCRNTYNNRMNKDQKNFLSLLSFGVPEILIISLVSNLKKKNRINGKEIIKCAIKKAGLLSFKRKCKGYMLLKKNIKIRNSTP